jgi:alkyl sulfatase BDS1-like metallo-beta-lactamase superfamily hydrolase
VNKVKIVKVLYKFPSRDLMIARVNDTAAWKNYKTETLKNYPADHDVIFDLFSLKVLLIHKKK